MLPNPAFWFCRGKTSGLSKGYRLNQSFREYQVKVKNSGLEIQTRITECCVFLACMESRNISRLEWAVAETDILPGHRVLEIGPGTGIALEILARRVPAGSVVALDKSLSMLTKAESRLKAAGLTKRVIFINDAAATVDLSQFRFDRVIAFNVNIFYMNTDLTCVLDPVVRGGVIGLFYQNPPGSDTYRLAGMLEKVTTSLKRYHFEVINAPVYSDAGSTPTGGVVARKK